jgi:hypothetical protein
LGKFSLKSADIARRITESTAEHAETAEENVKTEDRGQKTAIRRPFSVLRCAVFAHSAVKTLLVSAVEKTLNLVAGRDCLL